ncbi:hypothetical protein D3C75_792030 [compost metagenome]
MVGRPAGAVQAEKLAASAAIFSASASTTRGQRVSSQMRRSQPLSPLHRPRPGPMSIALREEASPASACGSAAAQPAVWAVAAGDASVSGASISSGGRVAAKGVSEAGSAQVTRPLPPRSAAEAESSPAPIMLAEPAATSTWP